MPSIRIENTSRFTIYTYTSLYLSSQKIVPKKRIDNSTKSLRLHNFYLPAHRHLSRQFLRESDKWWLLVRMCFIKSKKFSIERVDGEPNRARRNDSLPGFERERAARVNFDRVSTVPIGRLRARMALACAYSHGTGCYRARSHRHGSFMIK